MRRIHLLGVGLLSARPLGRATTGVLVLVVALIFAIFPSLAMAAPTFTVRDLGTLGGSTADPSGLNASGHAVGNSTDSKAVLHGFFFNGTTMRSACSLVRANAVNASDLIAGELWVKVHGNTVSHPATCLGTTQHDLGALTSNGYGTAVDINATGDVTGYSSSASGELHAFLYSGGTMRDLGTPGVTSYGYGINRFDTVVGDSGSQAFVYDSLGMHNVGVLPGYTFSSLNDVNDSGDAVGTSTTNGGYQVHAMAYTNGLLVDLGALPGHLNSEAYAINNHGDIVGSSWYGADIRAFLYWQGTMLDLNSLVPTGSPALWRAYDINDNGQILATDNDNHAYLLTPNGLFNTTPPAIKGLLFSGETATADPGNWWPSASSFTYQWDRCNSSGTGCTPIPGATGSSYTASSADVGSTLVVEVNATGAAGTSSAESAASSPVLSPVASYGLAYRPNLLFHLGLPAPDWTAEKWRPLNVSTFLTEAFDDGTGTRLCQHSTGTCQALTFSNYDSLLAANNNTDSYLEVAGDFSPGPDPSDPNGGPCLHTVSTGATVDDCDDWPRSAIYYTVGEDSTGYRYFDYWFYYRDNRPGGTFGELDDHWGDWEGVTVVLDGANAGVGSPAFAYYAAHNGGVWYDANALPLAGDHVKDFVALGTHASYPFSCTSACSTNSDVSWPYESPHDGGAQWGNNDDGVCEGFCAQRMTSSETWPFWLGRWGQSTGSIGGLGDSPQSPGQQSRFQCAVSGYSAGCTRPPGSRQEASRATLQTPSPASCKGWLGSGVSVLACDPVLLQNALKNHTMRSGGALHLHVPGRRSGDSPGLAQVIGEPLRVGNTIRVSGHGTRRTTIWVAVAAGGHLYRCAVKYAELPSRRTLTLHVVGARKGPTLAIGKHLLDASRTLIR
jgi:probable HAF family extracellular repeat protein